MVGLIKSLGLSWPDWVKSLAAQSELRTGSDRAQAGDFPWFPPAWTGSCEKWKIIHLFSLLNALNSVSHLDTLSACCYVSVSWHKRSQIIESWDILSQDHQSSAPDHPKSHIMCLSVVQMLLEFRTTGLVLWPHPWGSCYSAQLSSGWRTFSFYPPWMSHDTNSGDFIGSCYWSP